MRIKWNIGGFKEIRKSPGVVGDINSRAGRVAAACGEGFESSPYDGVNRHRASVITATPKAMARNAKRNTLINKLGAGGG